MELLGVRVDNFSKKEILQEVESFLAEEKFHQIATVNPEFILEAQKDEGFRDVLNDCEMNVTDGIGIWFAYLRFGEILKSRMAGADLVEEILKMAERNNHTIFLAVGKDSLSSWEETRAAILEKYPKLEISGMDLEKEPITDYQLLVTSYKQIADYEIIFCSFGAPHQEKFLHSLKSQKNSRIRLAMGVGGSFDFLTGKRKRAPKIMRKIGLEWLWRFAQEPKYRAKRIFNAVIIFPIKIIINQKIL